MPPEPRSQPQPIEPAVPVLPSAPVRDTLQPAEAPDQPANDEEPAGGLERLMRDAVALERLIGDALEGLNTPAPNGARAFRLARQRGPRRRGALFLAIGAAAVSVMLVVGTLALVYVLHRSPRTQEAANVPNAVVVPHAVVVPNAAEVNAAAAWAARELPHAAQLVADPDMRNALNGVGFSNVRTASAALEASSRNNTPLSFDYVVSSAALRAVDRANGPVARALQASLPIAVFGSGPHQLVVRQASTESAADIASRRRADDQIRLTAGRQLLANPAIRASRAVEAVLEAGALDLRAATVLALMANSSHVNILTVNIDKPEQAAGLPARSIDVRTDAAPAVQAMLSNLSPSYRPSVTQLPNGSNRIVWPIMPIPPVALN
ncbi:MAG: hypothetical protein DLM57_10435 [Pseudonocardiales bacterium]|nr:MAG: hypothetical protein DLM57_10435 [Pseudonocardiales bacterium]